MFALSSSRRTLIAAVAAVAFSALPCILNAQDSDDPPPEAGRISFISGNVSIQPSTADEWGQAYPNLPIGPGDRIFTDNGGRAEIQIGRTYVRVGPNSDVTLVEDSQFNINFGVAQGSIRLHSFGLWPRQLVDISTPNGNAEFGEQGDLRVDVVPENGATVFTNLGQFADITGAGDYRQQLDYGQSLEVAGTNPVYPQWLQPAGPDELDSWSQQRDQSLAQVASYNYVSRDVPGAAELDTSGDWQAETEYGPMWFPRGVSADWQPYHNGHWINREPWGWVWVEDEPWGYAPFHYGRWVVYRDRWGWVPGPVNVRPVWSPALVVFAGGGGGGLSLSAWFPLGPGEAYRPWYRCSPRYYNQVNITNIRESSRVHVQNTYVNVTNITNVTYINRTHVTAVRRDDFASGRRVRDVAVRMDPRQAQQIRPLERPEVVAPSRPIITRPVAHVPAKVERPMLINQRGQSIAARPGAAPVAPPVRQAPPSRPLPGRTVIAAPARQTPNGRGPQNQFPAAQGNRDQRPDNRPNQPNQPGQANQPLGTPRANPATVVPGYQRGVEQRPGNQPTANPNDRQQPPQPKGRPVPPTYQQQENRQNPPQMNQPDHGRPNDIRPNDGHPNDARPNDGRPNDPRQGRPDNPQRPDNPRQDRPNNQPVPPNYQQPQRPVPPNNPPQDRPIPPSYQQPNPQPGRPAYPMPDRRNQPNEQPQPRPNQPQTPPPSDRNRPDFGQGQPRRDTPPQDRPTPPQYNPPPQQRPPQRDERQAPPPQQDRQYTPPPPQQRPPQREERPAPPPQQYTPPPQRPQPQHEDRQAPPPRTFERPRQNPQPPPQARPQQNDKPNKEQKKDKEEKKPN